MKKRKHGIEGWPRERNTVGEREGKGRDSWTGASANVLFKAVGVAAASWLVIYELIPKSWTPWGWLRTLTRDLLLSGYVIDRLAPAPFALVNSTRPNPLSLSFLPSFLIPPVAIFFYFPPTLLPFSTIVTLIFQLIPSFPFVFLVASFRGIQTFPFLRSSSFVLFFDCFQERFCLRATCIEIFVADRLHRLWNETCLRSYIFWNSFNRILVI